MRDNLAQFPTGNPRRQASVDVRDKLNEVVGIANVLTLALGNHVIDWENEDVRGLETVANDIYNRLHRLARECEEASTPVKAEGAA